MKEEHGKVLPADLERFILLESGCVMGRSRVLIAFAAMIGIHNDLSQIDCN